jgi:hypothetical protein
MPVIKRWSGEVRRGQSIDLVSVASAGEVLRVWHERRIGTLERDAPSLPWVATPVGEAMQCFPTRKRALAWLLDRDDAR